jgi:hypothetical protein
VLEQQEERHRLRRPVCRKSFEKTLDEGARRRRAQRPSHDVFVVTAPIRNKIVGE